VRGHSRKKKKKKNSHVVPLMQKKAKKSGKGAEEKKSGRHRACTAASVNIKLFPDPSTFLRNMVISDCYFKVTLAIDSPVVSLISLFSFYQVFILSTCLDEQRTS
jgi:hypothetical protein